MTVFLYLIICNTPDHMYVGISTGPSKRIWKHQHGEAAEFTKKHGVSSGHIIDKFSSWKQAKRAEIALVRELTDEIRIVCGAGRSSEYHAHCARKLKIRQKESKERIDKLLRDLTR
jgi:predicted GIY-YIG superfamily endonuclease